MCQPGRPVPHGDLHQRSPSACGESTSAFGIAFHSAKSNGWRLLRSSAAVSSLASAAHGSSTRYWKPVSLKLPVSNSTEPSGVV